MISLGSVTSFGRGIERLSSIHDFVAGARWGKVEVLSPPQEEPSKLSGLLIGRPENCTFLHV